MSRKKKPAPSAGMGLEGMQSFLAGQPSPVHTTADLDRAMGAHLRGLREWAAHLGTMWDRRRRGLPELPE